MQTLEFETIINKNNIRIPDSLIYFNKLPAKVRLEFQPISEVAEKRNELLVKAFKKAQEMKIFDNIENSILWQKGVRDEWQ